MKTRKSSDSSKAQSNDSKTTPKEPKPHNSPRLGGFFDGKKLKPIDLSPPALVPTPREEGIGPTPPPPAGSPSS